jgi:hypothetical protein
MPDLKELDPKDLDVKPSVPERKPAPKFKQGIMSKLGELAGTMTGSTQAKKISSDLAEGSYRLKYEK